MASEAVPVNVNPSEGRFLHSGDQEPSFSIEPSGKWAFVLEKSEENRIFRIDLSTGERIEYQSPNVQKILAISADRLFSIRNKAVDLCRIGDISVETICVIEHSVAGRKSIRHSYSDGLLIISNQSNVFTVVDYSRVISGESVEPECFPDLRAPMPFGDSDLSWRWDGRILYCGMTIYSEERQQNSVAVWSMNWDTKEWKWNARTQESRRKTLNTAWLEKTLVICYAGGEILFLYVRTNWIGRRIQLIQPNADWKCFGIYAAADGQMNIVFHSAEYRCVRVDFQSHNIKTGESGRPIVEYAGLAEVPSAEIPSGMDISGADASNDNAFESKSPDAKKPRLDMDSFWPPVLNVPSVNSIRVNPRDGLLLHNCSQCDPDITISPSGRWAFVLERVVGLSNCPVRCFDLACGAEYLYQVPQITHIVAMWSSLLLLIRNKFFDLRKVTHRLGSRFCHTQLGIDLKESRQFAFTNGLVIAFDETDMFEVIDYTNVSEHGLPWPRPEHFYDMRAPVSFGQKSVSWFFNENTGQFCVACADDSGPIASVDIWDLPSPDDDWVRIPVIPHWEKREPNEKVKIVFDDHYIIVGSFRDSDFSLEKYNILTKECTEKLEVNLGDAGWKCRGMYSGMAGAVHIILEKNEIRCIQVDMRTAQMITVAAIESPTLGRMLADPRTFPNLSFPHSAVTGISISPCGRLLLAAFGDELLLAVDLLLGDELLFGHSHPVYRCHLVSTSVVLIPGPTTYLPYLLDYGPRNDVFNLLVPMAAPPAEMSGRIFPANDGEYFFCSGLGGNVEIFNSNFQSIGRIPWISNDCLFYVKDPKAEIYVIADRRIFQCNVGNNEVLWIHSFDKNIIPRDFLMNMEFAWAWSGSRLITRWSDCAHKAELRWLDVVSGQRGAKSLDCPDECSWDYGEMFSSNNGSVYMLAKNEGLCCVQIPLWRPDSLLNTAMRAFQCAGLSKSLLPPTPLIAPILPDPPFDTNLVERLPKPTRRLRLSTLFD